MRTHRARGFTLVEMLVVVTVTLVVIAGVTVVVNSQQKSYLDGQRLRGAEGAARRAMLALEQALPQAGHGMDAALAFDLQGWTTGPCPTATMGTCPRDATTNSDELVFFAREQKYFAPQPTEEDPVGNAWRIRAVTSSAVTVMARAGDVFRNGQIFLGVCAGSSAYAYFTASQTVQVAAAADRAISLQPVVAANPFRRQDVAAALPCFNPPAIPAIPATPARLYLVNRFRFHVRPSAIGTLAGVTQYDPLLVLDRGVDTDLDGDVDQDDEELVAEGIESLQVAYGFYSGTLAPAGTTAGTVITTAAAAPSGGTTTAERITTTLFPGTGTLGANETIYALSSFYPYTYGPPPATQRQTNHQGNIQYVRVAVLARSLETDVQGSGRAARHLPLLNQDAAPGWITAYQTALGGHDGYQRVVLDTSVGLPNMGTRAMTYF